MVSGYYNPTAGSNVYYACPPGSYTNERAGASCDLAGPGYYAPFPASTELLPCTTSLLPGAVVCNSGRVLCCAEGKK